MKISERGINAAQALANTGMWNEVRDEIIYPLQSQVRDVTENFGRQDLFEIIKQNPAVGYAARILASAVIDELVSLIERQKEVKTAEKENFE